MSSIYTKLQWSRTVPLISSSLGEAKGKQKNLVGTGKILAVNLLSTYHGPLFKHNLFFNLHSNSMKYYHLCFTDEETEIQEVKQCSKPTQQVERLE